MGRSKNGLIIKASPKRLLRQKYMPRALATTTVDSDFALNGRSGYTCVLALLRVTILK